MSAFLAEAVPEPGVDPSLDVLTEMIREEEVQLAIEGLAPPRKSPGPDGLTSEFYKTFKDVLVPLLTEVFNECLSSGTLPKRVERGPLAGMDQAAPEATLRVVAYADDVTVFVSSHEEAGWLMSEVDRYSEASGSKINRDKCESLWLGGDPGFDLPDTLTGPKVSAKVLGIEFGQGGYPKQNWDSRLEIATQKVNQWKGMGDRRASEGSSHTAWTSSGLRYLGSEVNMKELQQSGVVKKQGCGEPEQRGQLRGGLEKRHGGPERWGAAACQGGAAWRAEAVGGSGVEGWSSGGSSTEGRSGGGSGVEGWSGRGQRSGGPEWQGAAEWRAGVAAEWRARVAGGSGMEGRSSGGSSVEGLERRRGGPEQRRGEPERRLGGLEQWGQWCGEPEQWHGGPEQREEALWRVELAGAVGWCGGSSGAEGWSGGGSGVEGRSSGEAAASGHNFSSNAMIAETSHM
ncbi:unnamed protein product [Ranitomeya imitator]|uniref:Reverse transcriptase domain-containing protein n=1 Tax=Ranitomeya imitator TaxID=111125 RepID=A0ABN9MAB6_9NEOB|nr:unnamed protein product [Ranitomeya imitator]